MNDGVENKKICTAKMVNGSFVYEIINTSSHADAVAGLRAVNDLGNFCGIYKGSSNWGLSEGDSAGFLNSSSHTYFINLQECCYKWINIDGEGNAVHLMELTKDGELQIKNKSSLSFKTREDEPLAEVDKSKLYLKDEKLRLRRKKATVIIDREIELCRIGAVQGYYINGSGVITHAELIEMGWAKCDGTTPESQGISDPIRIGNTPTLIFAPANNDIIYYIKVK